MGYTMLDTLFTRITETPSDDLIGQAYDQILQRRNVSLDREILMRQKLRFADAQTLRLFQRKDSMLTCLGKMYEQPVASRRRDEIMVLDRDIRVIEDTILYRVHYDNTYFLSLSVKFMRAVYEDDPSLRCLFCRWKTALKKGDSALAHELSRYAAAQANIPAKWQQVQHQLTPKEIAIEFVTYRDIRRGTLQYGALILRRNDANVRFIALCSQHDLDEVLARGKVDDAYYLEQLYSPHDDDAATLYRLIWQPLETLMQGIRQCYYTPAGDLNRLNIAALSQGFGREHLQDRYTFIRINSTRSLINSAYVRAQASGLPAISLPCRLRKEASPMLVTRFFGSIAVDYSDPNLQESRSAVMLGNIYYDMDSAAIRSPKANYPVPVGSETGAPRRRQLGRFGTWEALYGTKAEVETIADALKKAEYRVKTWQGYAASEEAFKTLGQEKPSPRILHIATHGFFLPDTLQGWVEHPMNRTGLILAGANHAWSQGKPIRSMEDGILTAFEIAAMDLSNTELVVLSACETGLGYIVNNEGVFGLQRAFKQAGAKNLMVSLWSIPDHATQVLMTQFYHNCLVKNMSLRYALQAAQQWMRSQVAYQNPYYWAGFVLLE